MMKDYERVRIDVRARVKLEFGLGWGLDWIRVWVWIGFGYDQQAVTAIRDYGVYLRNRMAKRMSEMSYIPNTSNLFRNCTNLHPFNVYRKVIHPANVDWKKINILAES